MAKYTLNENRELMQRIELSMLCELKPILERNGIPFTLSYGSALGCYRHKGYIPWDDDTDIQILARDLPRLLKVFEEQDTGHLRLDYFTSMPGYPFVFPKIVDDRTILIEEKNTDIGYRCGIFIDVFTLYSVPDSPLASRLLVFVQYLRSRMIRSHCHPVRSMHGVQKLAGLFLHLFTSQRRLQKRFHRTVVSPRLRGGRCISTDCFSTAFLHDRKLFEDIVEMPFEGASMPMVRDADTYLRTEYGDDYMTLPPEDQRGTEHFIAELDVSRWLREQE